MCFELVACLSLIDALAYNYLMPIAENPMVEHLWIVRPKKNEYGEIPKTSYYLAPSKNRLVRFIKMLKNCILLGNRNKVKAFISFNPIPYGLIAMIAARIFGKPIHFGFIGSDWYHYVKGTLGKFLIPILRQADFFTVTGQRMREEMLKYGFDPQKITILPHSINLSHFQIFDGDEKRYTFIFVGQLIRRKRVDLILEGFSKVLLDHPNVTLCIVGDGPLLNNLKNQAKDLGISRAIEFTGYTIRVHSFLKQARIVVMASNMEGFPFALVEAMCTGLVPISTPVGTIPDFIINEQNGLLVQRNDSNALARAMSRLHQDKKLYEKLRQNVFKTRSYFSYNHAKNVWERWLNSLK